MPNPDPEHLFDQADKLIAPPPAGPPLQVDLRRAISAAYYGVFHRVLAALADEFVGRTKRGTPAYELMYRSIQHRGLRDLCNALGKVDPQPKYLPYLPIGGIGRDLQLFSVSAVDLQERRHTADYNPTPRFRTSDAQLAITLARSATARFDQASADQRKAFLTLLLCPPR